MNVKKNYLKKIFTNDDDVTIKHKKLYKFENIILNYCKRKTQSLKKKRIVFKIN